MGNRSVLSTLYLQSLFARNMFLHMFCMSASSDLHALLRHAYVVSYFPIVRRGTFLLSRSSELLYSMRKILGATCVIVSTARLLSSKQEKYIFSYSSFPGVFAHPI